MKKLKCFLLAATFILGTQQIWAQEFTLDGINYSGSIDTHTATVIPPAQHPENCSGDIIIPSTVTYGGNTYTVTKIGNKAFSDTNISSVSLPNTITEIGNYAFLSKTLQSVDLGQGVTRIGSYAFQSCPIKSLHIPKSVTFIADAAFAATTLESLTLEEGLTHIGKSAFGGTKIKSVTIPKSVTFIGLSAFTSDSLNNIEVKEGNTNYCSEDGILYSINKDTLLHFPVLRKGVYYAPTSLKVISMQAFYKSNLSSVILSDSIKYIGYYGFAYSKIRSFIAPNAVALHADDACFCFCENLDTIILSKKANFADAFPNDGIGHLIYFFDKENNKIDVGCSVSFISSEPKIGSIKKCIIPEFVKINGNNIPVTSILKDAFNDCIIEELTIPKTINKMESRYKNCGPVYIDDMAHWLQMNFTNQQNNPLYYGGNLYLNGNLVTGKFEIPPTVDSIGDYAFYNYKQINSLIIPNSVKTIGKYAFSNTAVDSITLGNAVNSISEYAFAGTPSQYIYLPASVRKVAGSAFSGYLMGFKVAEDNPNFCAVDGILYSHSKDTLIAYPNARKGTFTIPEGVTTIGKYAFYRTRLDSIIIANSVSSIGEEAFSYCNNLKMLFLPAVKHIAKDAFSRNDLLLTIYCMETTPAECEDNPFNTNVVLWVPAESVNTYKNATYWNDFPIYSMGDFLNSIKDATITTSDSKNGVYYDLQGRRINKPTTKGIYIRNGKKFLIQ